LTCRLQLLCVRQRPIYYRLLITGEAVDYVVADRAAAATLAAARAGACTN
jgi:hypothetical protein